MGAYLSSFLNIIKLTLFSKLENVFAAVVSGTVFFLLFHLNDFLFSQLTYSTGVSWVFLPSGLRLLLVLMFAGSGAVGVVLGSLVVGLDRPMGPEVTLAAAVISGLSPWLARWICLRTMQIQSDLRELNALRLLQMALVFSTVSAVLHQALYTGTGLSPSFLEGTAVMAIGDLLGTMVVLYAVKLALWRPGH
jgi:hypothetical protein